METIKSHTDLSQSKTLSKILPLESADMYYKYALPKSDRIIHTPEIGNPIDSLKWYNEGYTFRGKREPITLSEYCIPCWSLAALISVVPNGIVMNKDCQNGKYHFSSAQIGTYVKADNPIDACYELILKLHELKKL